MKKKTLKEFLWNVEYYYNNPTSPSETIGSYFVYFTLTFPEKCAMNEDQKAAMQKLADMEDDKEAIAFFLNEFVDLPKKAVEANG